jgi:hypothetical protein
VLLRKSALTVYCPIGSGLPWVSVSSKMKFLDSPRAILIEVPMALEVKTTLPAAFSTSMGYSPSRAMGAFAVS